MHFSPYHKKKSWQRFLIGILIGSILAYCILLFMYGSMYEKLIDSNYDLQSQLIELKNQNEALLQDNKEIDEKNRAPQTVERIEITIANAKQLQLDRLTIRQLDELIKAEINHIIGNDIQLLNESHQLLQAAIENKSFKIDDATYSFDIKMLVISSTLKLTLHAKLFS